MHFTVDRFPGRTISKIGQSYLYFGGTAYLGLQTDSDFQNLFLKNSEIYGTNYGASRKSNIQISIFSDTEQYLAKYVGSQSCITLSSGYMASQLVAQSFNSKDYKLFYAPNTHPSLHLKANPQDVSYESLNTSVRLHLETSKSTPVVFLDSIDTMGYNYPTFSKLKQLPLEDIILVVDDSHGIGVIEENGIGVFSELQKLCPKELIVCCSLGKGFGIQGGAIFGLKHRIGQFINTDYFGGASPASPAALATLTQGESIFKEKRLVLQQNITQFIETLSNISQFKHITDYPVFSYANTNLTAYLEANNIIVTNFRYPTENDAVMSRIVISAGHSSSDIEKLAITINQIQI